VAGRANSGEAAQRAVVVSGARCCYCERVRQENRRVRSGAPGCGWSDLEGRATGRDGHRPSPPVYGRRVAAGQAGEAGAARPRAGEWEEELGMGLG
jgi:hypothetical protein